MTVWDYALLLAVSLIMLIFFMYMFWRESLTRGRERPAEVYTVIKCGDGAERKRKYQDGDYVGKQTEECAGGVITGIYKETPQQ
jgi:hypothetical protein